MTLEVVAYDRMGLMLDLMRVLNDRRINLRAVASDTDADLGTARLSLTVDVTDFSTLAGAVSALEAVANVVSVERRKAA